MSRAFHRRHAEAPGWPVLMSSGVLLAAAVVVAARVGQGGHLLAAPVPPVPIGPHPPGRIPVSGKSADAAPLVAALAALAGVAVIALWRGRRWASASKPGPAAGSLPLADAVAAGRSALDGSAGAREAIIACYAAMGAALAAAGSSRRADDTPEELLRRAVANGVVRASAAARLTALFRESRFSPHQIADAQRDGVRAALDEISGDMAGESRPPR
jgi:hypothetical protein